jgi:hypothetical protein
MKNRSNSVTDYKKQNILSVLLGATIIFAGFPRFLLIFPTFSQSFIAISWVLGIVGFLAIIARNYSPHIRILEIIYLDLIILFALIAIRSYGYLNPSSQMLWAVIITVSCAISYLIPIFNPSLTKLMRRELVAPRTALGRAIAIGALFIMPLGGTMATFFGMSSARQDDKFALAVVMGNLVWMLALFLPFGTLHRISSLEKE